MTLNEAIYLVLTVKFKKDAPDVFKAVEAAGYGITKNNGHFEVYNSITHRTVYIYGAYRPQIHYGYYNNNRKDAKTREQALKFDFVGYLNKPQNRAYYEPYYTPDRPTLVKYNKLTSAKDTVAWRTRDIEKKLEQIAKLQKELIHEVEYKTEAVARLNKVRKELGLK